MLPPTPVTDVSSGHKRFATRVGSKSIWTNETFAPESKRPTERKLNVSFRDVNLNLTYARVPSLDNSAEFETAVAVVGMGQGALLISDLSPSLIKFENPGLEEAALAWGRYLHGQWHLVAYCYRHLSATDSFDLNWSFSPNLLFRQNLLYLPNCPCHLPYNFL